MKQLNRTQLEQDQVHAAIKQIYLDYNGVESTDEQLNDNKYYKEYEPLDSLDIQRDAHIYYCTRKLTNLGKSIVSLDVGQPWSIYWPLNALDILDAPIKEYSANIVKFLTYCQTDGFGGGHMQYSHLAPTYSAFLSLLIVGTPEALQLIDRPGLERFFKSIQDPAHRGSYIMHVNGETDLRAVYIVVIIVMLLNLDKSLIEHCPEYIAKCQTYEGGLGGIPFTEAHGGYTYCGYAALLCMGKSSAIDESRLLNWVVQRQMQGEGGFNGRTNKVVDACYSFWQGAIFRLLADSNPKFLSQGGLLMNADALQRYIQICQQYKGGLFDKPGKPADTYHTCYALSGFSLSHMDSPMDPIYNVKHAKVEQARVFFTK